MMRIENHPILGAFKPARTVRIWFNDTSFEAIEGEPILAALAAHGVRQCRETTKRHEPRWLFCGIGRCTDCVMIVNGQPNVRTCVTPVKDDMRIEIQRGVGTWSEDADRG